MACENVTGDGGRKLRPLGRGFSLYFLIVQGKSTVKWYQAIRNEINILLLGTGIDYSGGGYKMVGGGGQVKSYPDKN